MWLGMAHTDGDGVVYFPREEIMTTGDITMNDCLPYMGNSYPYNWINRKQYLSELMAGSAEAYAQGATLDEARKRLLPTYAPAKIRGRG